MKLPVIPCLLLVGGIFLSSLLAQTPAPSSLRRALPAAGPAAKTVIVSDAPALPFSLLDLRLVVAGLLSRVQTTFAFFSVEEVTKEALSSADYVVLLNLRGSEQMTEVYRRMRQVPAENGAPPPRLLVIGALAAGAATVPGKAAPPLFRVLAEAEVRWGELSWRSEVGAWAEGVQVPTAQDRVLGEVIEAAGKNPQPLAWKEAQAEVWHFRALPTELLIGRLLAEVALDFYGVGDPGPSGVVLVLSEVAAGGDPTSLRKMADWCLAQGIPFAVGLRSPGTELSPLAEHHLASSVLYAVARGGRLLWHGDDQAWWNVAADAPPAADAVAQARQALSTQLESAQALGFLPLGLLGPDRGASTRALSTLQEVTLLRVGSWQVSDATAAVTFPAVTVLAEAVPAAGGRGVLLPTATWLPWEENSPADRAAWDMARQLLRLRGTLLVVAVPAWEPFDQLQIFLEKLRQTSGLFLDVLEAPVAVQATNSFWQGHHGWEAFPYAREVAVAGRAYDSHGREIAQKTFPQWPTQPPAEPAQAVLWWWQKPQQP